MRVLCRRLSHNCINNFKLNLTPYIFICFQDNEIDLRMLIHQSLAGCVIGKGGSKIKELRDVSSFFFFIILIRNLLNEEILCCSNFVVIDNIIYVTFQKKNNELKINKLIKHKIKKNVIMMMIGIGITLKTVLIFRFFFFSLFIQSIDV